MSKKSSARKPAVYVTESGGLYVKADELLRSNAAREQIDGMAKISVKKSPSGVPKQTGRRER